MVCRMVRFSSIPIQKSVLILGERVSEKVETSTIKKKFDGSPKDWFNAVALKVSNIFFAKL